MDDLDENEEIAYEQDEHFKKERLPRMVTGEDGWTTILKK
ncbi:hypothetical protein DICVIV_05263 [Dictyocaulus viviparus]|uniref:Uncharacterized protein n=1 Tax=Dictyocaulus viviparus TaxID=29172 RepID=A0A0D8XVU3_DICVI|nr:hypothetical protein DICVIV_05263 [Dictyocaulus viviparus]